MPRRSYAPWSGHDPAPLPEGGSQQGKTSVLSERSGHELSAQNSTRGSLRAFKPDDGAEYKVNEVTLVGKVVSTRATVASLQRG